MKKRKTDFRSSCPISTALDIFGDKWSLLILRDLLFKGKNTYGDFLSSDEGISTNILADRLLLLETNDIITKHAHPDSKAKVLYHVTEKGLDLIPLLVEIIEWSEKYYTVHPYAVEFAKAIRKDKKAVIQQARKEVQKSLSKL